MFACPANQCCCHTGLWVQNLAAAWPLTADTRCICSALLQIIRLCKVCSCIAWAITHSIGDIPQHSTAEHQRSAASHVSSAGWLLGMNGSMYGGRPPVLYMVDYVHRNLSGAISLLQERPGVQHVMHKTNLGSCDDRYCWVQLVAVSCIVTRVTSGLALFDASVKLESWTLWAVEA